MPAPEGRPLENEAGREAGLTIGIRQVRSVAHETASFCNLLRGARAFE